MSRSVRDAVFVQASLTAGVATARSSDELHVFLGADGTLSDIRAIGRLDSEEQYLCFVQVAAGCANGDHGRIMFVVEEYRVLAIELPGALQSSLVDRLSVLRHQIQVDAALLHRIVPSALQPLHRILRDALVNLSLDLLYRLPTISLDEDKESFLFVP